MGTQYVTYGENELSDRRELEFRGSFLCQKDSQRKFGNKSGALIQSLSSSRAVMFWRKTNLREKTFIISKGKLVSYR